MDTIALLRLLDGIPTQKLSRGEAIRHGIDEAIITTAAKLNQIIITSTDNTRDGEKSSLATLTLTDIGEQVLDAID